MPNFTYKPVDNGHVMEITITEPPKAPYTTRIKTEQLGSMAQQILSAALKASVAAGDIRDFVPTEGEAVPCIGTSGVWVTDASEEYETFYMTFGFGSTAINIALSEEHLAELGSLLMTMAGGDSKKKPN